MRDLTQKEIDAAPDWATHYFVDVEDCVMYESSDLVVWRGLDGPIYNVSISATAKLIPRNRKTFDISKYEFSDLEICRQIQASDEEIQLDMVDRSRPAILKKQDSIAIAKHFNLTADDLK